MKEKLGWILSLTLCFALMIAATLVTASASASVSYIDANGDEQTCDSATVVTESSIEWTGGWYVVKGNVTIDQRITVTGSVHLILKDGCNLTVNGGINVTDTNSLTIYGQENGTGALTANGGFLQAAIGGYNYSGGGNITINGGTVTATGGQSAAGIGGDFAGVGDTITINGGIVKATGGSDGFGGGAGIGGGGQSSNATRIKITGGVIIAEGGSNGAAGIGGGGHDGKLESISITGGWIQATGHRKNGQDDDANQGYANAIGGGAGDGGGPADPENFSNTVIIDGHTQKGTVYGSASLEENAEIPEGYTLTVPSGATLTIPKDVTLTNNGTITVSGTLTNNGTIVDNGTINGTVSGDVRYPSRVTVSLTQGGQSVTSVSYGSTVTITATMQRAQTNGINAIAELGYVNFYLGGTDGTLLGSANVTTGSNGAYTAALTLDDNIWAKGFNIGSNTITADFGGVAGTSGDGLVSNTGTAELTVTKASQTAPDAPTMSSRTTNSVTLNAISGGQGTVQYGYVKGNSGTPSSWQNGTTFSGLQPGTDYTFYACYAGNDYYNESPVSAGLTVTTLPEITASNLDAGYVGVPYNATLNANAGSGKTVTWTLASGTLPDGLTLNNNGTISGTPKAAVTNYTFTVQATINDAGNTPVSNSQEMSITINAGTSVVSITYGSGTYTYGERITISGSITASNQAPNNGINSIAEPEQNQVGLYSGETQLATAEVTDGSFTITYDTAGQGIQIGENQTLTVKYGGSNDLNSGSTTVNITLNAKPVTATVTNTITKAFDGNTDAAVELAVASKDLVNADDKITVTGTGTYSSADAGENIGVTVSNIQTDGDDSAWYTVSAPTGVTGAITKATQEAPNAPTVIERTSSSVTLAALGTTGQGALEYGYTTSTEGEPGHWQTGTTFTGLTSGTAYTFYTRYAGNNNYHPAVSELGTETSTLSNTNPNVVNPGETITTDDGTTIKNDGEKITITPGDGGTATTITPDDGATVNSDGTVNVPGGSTVQTGGGPSITVGEDGATVDPDGGVTLPEGGSATVGDTEITVPGGGTITPNDDGSVTIPGGSTVVDKDGDEYTYPPEGGTLDPDGTVVYTVTVTFDSQGGSDVASRNVDVNTPVAEPDAPTRSGYSFRGWYTAASGGEEWDFSAPVTGDMTLYARWSMNNIPDTYDIELIVGEGGEARTSLGNASAGTSITVTATPDAGYELDYITVDGERIDGTTFKMPAHDVTVRVYFTDGSTLPFTDVADGDWFYDYVAYVYANGLMDGTSGTTFEPNANMTRAMVWAILARVDGETVTGANWVETAREWAMAWAVEHGIISGVTDTTIEPQGTATRAQCAAMLMRFAELQAAATKNQGGRFTGLLFTQRLPGFFRGALTFNLSPQQTASAWPRTALLWPRPAGRALRRSRR